jgi:hypothetical protein
VIGGARVRRKGIVAEARDAAAHLAEPGAQRLGRIAGILAEEVGDPRIGGDVFEPRRVERPEVEIALHVEVLKITPGDGPTFSGSGEYLCPAHRNIS